MVHLSRRPDEAGGATILVTLSLLIICAMTALAIDLGNSRQLDAKAQAAADAGALAAVQDLPWEGSDSDATEEAAETAIDYAAADYGSASEVTCAITDPGKVCAEVGTDIRITVVSPHDGSDQKVQVEVCEDTPTMFASAIGLSAPTVCRGAVARVSSPTGFAPAILALDPAACRGLELHSGARTVAANGSVQVNSSCSGSACSRKGQAPGFTPPTASVSWVDAA